MKKFVNWDSFNVDNALDEIDQKNALEEIALNANDILKNIEREDFEATLCATRKAADAMRSKVIVCFTTAVTNSDPVDISTEFFLCPKAFDTKHTNHFLT